MLFKRLSDISTATTTGAAVAPKRLQLNLTLRDYFLPLVFMLSMSLCGLELMPMYLFVLFLLMTQFEQHRYDFMIMVVIMLGGFGLTGEDSFFVKFTDIAMLLGFTGLIVLKKPPVLRHILVVWALYAAAWFVIALLSEETMAIQIRSYRTTLAFITMLIWPMIFGNKEFDIKEFFLRMTPYVLIMCAFYILDCFIINGHILLPRTFVFGGLQSSIFSPLIYSFGTFPRKYPLGLFLLLFIIYPIARYYKLRLWQWALIILALAASRTFTVIAGVLITYIVSMPKVGRTLRYALIAVITVTILYGVDSTLPATANNETPLRIKSSLDQIIGLNKKADIIDLADIGSGRVGQAIPKIQLMYDLDREWTGFGFLHPQLTKMSKYVIVNEFYLDVSQNEEVAIAVEIALVQVFMYGGYIGLAIHLLFLFFTWFTIRKLPYARYYLSVLIGVMLFGVGGFASTIFFDGMYLLGIAWAAVYLNARSMKEAPTNTLKSDKL